MVLSLTARKMFLEHDPDGWRWQKDKVQVITLITHPKNMSLGFMLQGKQLIRRKMSGDMVDFHLAKVKGHFIISWNEWTCANHIGAYTNMFQMLQGSTWSSGHKTYIYTARKSTCITESDHFHHRITSKNIIFITSSGVTESVRIRFISTDVPALNQLYLLN